MSPSGKSRRVVFVCRAVAGEAFRSAKAIRELDDVILLGVTEELPGVEGAQVFVDVVSVADVHDTTRLIDAVRKLRERHGALSQIVTAQETLLAPVAETNEALGLSGMSVETIRRTLDKSRLKSVLKAAGVNTPRDQVVTAVDDARRFVSEAGFPIVLKPLTGSGALATCLIHSAEELDAALELIHPSPALPVLAETYVCGQELCLDTISIGGEPQFHSICCYHPSILEALQHPETQWTCVMPRDIGGEPYRDFIMQGLAAIRALSVGNAMTHMEGFLHDGGIAFTDATLRPAGARIGPMLAFAYDVDPYRAWARAVVDGCFDGPWERRYAAGTIFLRGQGSGLVEHVEGIEFVNRQLGELMVDVRWPRLGARKSLTYTGDGFITVRHRDTGEVKSALELIAQTVRIVYSDESPSSGADGESWAERLRNYRRLNQPAWDRDSADSTS